MMRPTGGRVNVGRIAGLSVGTAALLTSSVRADVLEWGAGEQPVTAFAPSRAAYFLRTIGSASERKAIEPIFNLTTFFY